MSVFDVLSKDHQQVKRMLAELETGPTAATGADVRQLTARKKMVEELIIEESKHEAVEEMYFWPAVRERHPSGDELADMAFGQEQEDKKVLDMLGKFDPGLPEFEDVLARFIKTVRAHIFFEETSVWPGLADVLSAQEAADLGQKLEQGKSAAGERGG